MIAVWRGDIDALQFEAGEGRLCMVHRLAFRSLTGLQRPQVEDCLAYFQENAAVFTAAAALKIARAGGQSAGNLHLTSRDVRACMARPGGTTD